MKIALRFVLILGAVLFLSFHATAQVGQPQNADSLRERIKQVEAMNVSTSSAVQSKYKRGLLSLYTQFSTALKKDIADLKALDAAVGGADQESQKEIAKLSAELNRVTRKIQTLETELGVSPGASLPIAEGENTGAGNIKPEALIASTASPIIKSNTDTSAIPVADVLSAKEPSNQNQASSSNQANSNDADKRIEVS
jgi:hypothetical protein